MWCIFDSEMLTVAVTYELWTWVGPRKHVLFDGAQILHAKPGQLYGKGHVPGIPDDTLPWAVQKWLKPIDLPFWLWWAEGSISSIVFARWCQCAFMVNTSEQSICCGTLTSCYCCDCCCCCEMLDTLLMLVLRLCYEWIDCWLTDADRQGKSRGSGVYRWHIVTLNTNWDFVVIAFVIF